MYQVYQFLVRVYNDNEFTPECCTFWHKVTKELNNDREWDKKEFVKYLKEFTEFLENHNYPK